MIGGSLDLGGNQSKKKKKKNTEFKIIEKKMGNYSTLSQESNSQIIKKRKQRRAMSAYVLKGHSIFIYHIKIVKKLALWFYLPLVPEFWRLVFLTSSPPPTHNIVITWSSSSCFDLCCTKLILVKIAVTGATQYFNLYFPP